MAHDIEHILLNTYDDQTPIKCMVGKPGNAGACIVLGGMLGHGAQWDTALPRVIDTIQKGYSDAVTNDPEAALERSLQSANYTIAQIIKEYGKKWLAQFYFIGMGRKKNNVHFSRVGKMHAFLIFKNTITDLAPLTYDDYEKHNPLKTFSSIISGDLTPHSQLVFCTDSVLDYLSLERLKRTVADTAPGKREEAFRGLLAKAPGHLPFGIIILNHENGEYPAQNPTAPLHNRLRKPVQVTEEPSKIIAPAENKSPSDVSGARPLPKHTISQTFRTPPLFHTGEVKQSLTRIASQLWEKWHFFIKDINRPKSATSQRRRGYLSFKNASKKNPFALIAQSISALGIISVRGIQKLLAWWKHSTRMTKILVAIACVLLILFLLNISKTRTSQIQEKDIGTYNQTLEMIQSLEDRATSALLYSDITKAREILEEARTITQSLPTDNEDRNAKQAALLERITTQLNKTKNLSTIAHPLLIADLEIADTAINPKQLLAVQGILYTYSPATNTVFAINPADKSATRISATPGITGFFEQASVSDSGGIVFYHNNHGFIGFDPPRGAYTPVPVDIGDGQVDWFLLYQKKLYRFDSARKQLFRHNASGNGFGAGVAWITTTPVPEINQTRDIAIDGAIYLLLPSGNILKYVSGKPEPFIISKVDPWFSSPTRIVTNADMNNIYILDPQSKRLVIISKTGEMVNQYTSDAFDDLRDVVIEEKNKKVYLLNGKKIYGIVLGQQ